MTDTQVREHRAQDHAEQRLHRMATDPDAYFEEARVAALLKARARVQRQLERATTTSRTGRLRTRTR